MKTIIKYYLIVTSLLCLGTQSQVISTNLQNGNLFIDSTWNNYGTTYYTYGRPGKTNQLTLEDGKQMEVHGVNIVPINRQASQAFIRKKLSNGQTFDIGLSYTNNGFSEKWSGPIVGPAVIEYGLNGVIQDGYGNIQQQESGMFLKTSCDFLMEIKNSQLTQTNTSSAAISSASVVVPANATGDVDVLLEQSTDMITWTQCLPGTYNASTQKRFFRVRAVEK